MFRAQIVVLFPRKRSWMSDATLPQLRAHALQFRMVYNVQERFGSDGDGQFPNSELIRCNFGLGYDETTERRKASMDRDEQKEAYVEEKHSGHSTTRRRVRREVRCGKSIARVIYVFKSDRSVR